jgi:hypothetical protein
VAVDRVQFLLWNTLGVGAYFALVLSTDACTIQSLPEISPNLLYLAGLSAGGYVLGRFVRKPGINLQDATVTDSGPTVPSQESPQQQLPPQRPLPSQPAPVEAAKPTSITLTGTGLTGAAKVFYRSHNKAAFSQVDADQELTLNPQIDGDVLPKNSAS